MARGVAGVGPSGRVFGELVQINPNATSSRNFHGAVDRPECKKKAEMPKMHSAEYSKS